MPVEGSLPDAPNPDSVIKKKVVDQERKKNMYFAAIGFINDVKTGPFWEHSPILFDISGVRAGWGKVNKVCERVPKPVWIFLTKRQGMIKMYNAEVLSKFPVVQHFNFGSLFSFERDPNAAAAAATVHTSNQPSSHTISVSGNTSGAPTSRPMPQEGTRAPWATNPPATTPANAPPQAGVATAAPWAKPATAAPSQPDGSVPTRAPWAASGPGSAPAPGNAPTRAPWATGPR
jgi:serine/threonine-protein phosphatase 2A activator